MSQITVRYLGQKVGQLAETAAGIAFEYDPALPPAMNCPRSICRCGPACRSAAVTNCRDSSMIPCPMRGAAA